MEQLTAREIELLRSNPITFVSSKGKLVGAKPTIEGPGNDPVVNLFDAGAQGEPASSCDFHLCS